MGKSRQIKTGDAGAHNVPVMGSIDSDRLLYVPAANSYDMTAPGALYQIANPDDGSNDTTPCVAGARLSVMGGNAGSFIRLIAANLDAQTAPGYAAAAFAATGERYWVPPNTHLVFNVHLSPSAELLVQVESGGLAPNGIDLHWKLGQVS